MSSALSELCDAYVDPESGDRPCHKIVHDSEYTNDGQMQLNDMIDSILAGTSVTPALLVCPARPRAGMRVGTVTPAYPSVCICSSAWASMY